MIYIIIPVHNRKQYTLKCLACLFRQTTPNYRVIVVDDGSTDGTAEAIRTQFPDVIVLTGTGSLWWTGATNLGIRYAQKQWSSDTQNFILTLNDDTEVPDNYLETLLVAYEANSPCIVGSVSVDIQPPHRLLYAGTGMNLWLPHIDDWAKTRFQNNYDSLRTAGSYIRSETLPGRGMLIPEQVFAVIGLFDEQRFQHYMSDLDFTISARKAGFPLVISVNSVVYEYTDTTGFDVRQQATFRQFRQALTSIKSPINYPVRYRFARKHSPLGLFYFGLDMLRIAGGYALRRGLRLIQSARR